MKRDMSSHISSSHISSSSRLVSRRRISRICRRIFCLIETKLKKKKTDFVIYQNKVLGRYKRQNENSKKSLIKFSYGYLRTIAKNHNAKKMLITTSLDAIYIAVIHKSVLDIRAKSSHTQH